MKSVFTSMLLFITMLLFSACGVVSLSPKQKSIKESSSYVYTQVPMWTEKNRIIGTNYSRGLFIPLNSPVKIISIDSRKIVFTYLDTKLSYYTYTKYTKVDSGGMLERLFSTKKVNLSKYSRKKRKYISNGKIVVGMTKEEVILARGYPPFHATLSLKSNTWKYWENRFKTINVKFRKNKVVATVGYKPRNLIRFY